MSVQFAETLKKLRVAKGLSQRELAERVFVTRSTVARWENGSRVPNFETISRLSACLNVDSSTLLAVVSEGDDAPHVIMVDDRKIILNGALPVLQEVMPHTTVVGFTRPSEAVTYAELHRVALAFLDIEMGKTSGFDLCQALLEINPRTNVVYLTAYSDYAFDAWGTGASGFLLKPLTTEEVRGELKKLRYPFSFGGGQP